MDTLDALWRKLVKGKRCKYCYTDYGIEAHHIISRNDDLYRWDYRNCLPVCHKCHMEIHQQGLHKPKVDLPNISYRQYLVDRGITEQEFMEEKKQELLTILLTI